MSRKRSAILEAVHETATGLYNSGLIDKITLREFDSLCISTVEPLEPHQIKQIRESNHISQSVFAAILNISPSTIQKWEIGRKRPTGTALKLLHLVQKQGLDILL